MNNMEKIEQDCVNDLNLYLKTELNKKWVISHNSLSLNQFSITDSFNIGHIEIRYNSKLEVKPKTYVNQFEPSNQDYIEFYEVFHRFLVDNVFQDKIIDRYLRFKVKGEEMVNNRTYMKKYEKVL